MPETRELSREELAELARQGIDPTPYVGQKIPIYSDEEVGHQQNKQVAQADTSSNSSTALGAGARAGLSGALPSVAGGAGFVAGASPVLPWNAAAYAASPETLGISLAVPLISGAIASYGAGRLTGAAQDLVTPDSIKQQLQRDEQEHPTATTIGHLADIPLGGMSPSIGNLGNAVGSIPKLLMRAPLTATERQAAMQVAAGSILAGGQEAVQEKMEGKPLSLSSIAEQAGIGSLFNKPNAIGKMVGMHPQVDDPDLLSKTKLLNDLQSGNPQDIATGSKTATSMQKVENSSDVLPPDVSSTITGLPVNQGRVQKKVVPYLDREIGGEVEKNAMEAEGGNQQTDKNVKRALVGVDDIQDGMDYPGGEMKSNVGLTPQFQRESQIFTKPEEGTPYAFTNVRLVNNAVKSLKDSGINVIPEKVDNVWYLKHSSNNEYISEDAVKYDDGNNVKFNFQKQNTITTPLGEEVSSNLESQNIPTSPTKEWFDRLKSWGADIRGVKVGENGELKDQNGNTVNGVQFVKDGIKQVLVNPKTSSIDTLPHELYHAFIGDLETSSRPEDRAQVQKLYTLSKPGLDAYNQQAVQLGKQPITEHEFVTSEQGLEFLKQQLNLDKESPIKKWWNDTKSIFKSKFTGSATTADARRFLNYRFVNDRPSSPSVPVVNAGGTQTQEQSQLKPKFIGTQEHPIDKSKNIDLYNLQEPIKDATGKILHDTGSTVAKSTLDKYGVKYQNESQLGGLSKSDRFMRAIRVLPELQRFRMETGEHGKPVADAIQQYYGDKDNFYGKYMSPVLQASKRLGKSDINKVEGILTRENSIGQVLRGNLDARQAKLYDAIRSSLLQKQKDQIVSGQKVTDYDAKGKPFQRDAKINPTYYPNKIAPSVIETLTEHPNSPESRQLKKDFLDHQVSQGNSIETAKEKLKGLTAAWDSKNTNHTRFNAVRMTEGVGLPESWMKKDLLKNLSSYYNRVATDFSFYKNLESKPDVQELLNPENENGVSHAAQGMLEHIKGEPFDKDEATVKAANRVATSLLLGPLTNVHIGLSSVANSLQYLKPLEVPGAYTKALTGMSEGYRKALEQGYLRKDLNTVGDLIDNSNTAVERLRAASSLIGKLNGRQLTDTLTKSFLQGMGDFVVKNRIVEANNGDKYAQTLMKNLDPSWQIGKKYQPQELDQLASTFAGYIHGAHDARTLPAWMNKEGIIQPFFSLMSWSLAQTNAWHKNVWEPATRGNLQPLIMSTMGAVLGGYVIQQLRQEISGKKTAIPGLQEIANSSRGLSGNPGLLAYNFMQMASFTGWAGIMSTLGKDAMDMAYKNIPQGSTFPLDEVVTESAKTASEGVSAIMQAPNAEAILQIVPRVLADIARENVQIARIAMSWGAQAGITGQTEAYKKKLNVAENDLRQYRMVEGQPYDQQTESNNNPYLNLQQKSFKRTGDIREAASDVPRLLEIAEERAQGNPEILKQQLRGLKQNTYETIPSMPLQMMQYLSYLSRTQGPEVAQARLMDYIRQTTINRAKSSLIPSL